jgi:hypothetical protein
LDACSQITHVLSDWHPRNNNPARYGDDLPGKAVRVVGRLTPSRKMKRGAIMECAFEQLPNSVSGRGPTGPEIWAQYQGVIAESVGDDVEIIAYFPQAPKPNAGHIFDNTNDEQFAMCTKVMRDFAPQVDPAQPDPLAAITLALTAANAQIATLQEQNKELHERINSLEGRQYKVTW